MAVMVNNCYKAIARVQNNNRTEAFLFELDNSRLEYENYRRARKLIELGLVSNLVLKEITPENGEKYTQIRGYGCNLTKMPTFKSRNELLANYRNIIIPNEYRIKGVVVLNGNVVGYKILNMENKQDSKLITAKTAFGLMESALLTNCKLDNNRRIVCTDCDMSKLPVFIMDCKTGAISSEESINKATLIRHSVLKSNGILRNTKTKQSIQFKALDYLVVTPNGSLTIIKNPDFKKLFKVIPDRSYATCDAYLGNTNIYSIEFFGRTPQSLSAEFIKTLAVAEKIG